MTQRLDQNQTKQNEQSFHHPQLNITIGNYLNNMNEMFKKINNCSKYIQNYQNCIPETSKIFQQIKNSGQEVYPYVEVILNKLKNHGINVQTDEIPKNVQQIQESSDNIVDPSINQENSQNKNIKFEEYEHSEQQTPDQTDVNTFQAQEQNYVHYVYTLIQNGDTARCFLIKELYKMFFEEKFNIKQQPYYLCSSQYIEKNDNSDQQKVNKSETQIEKIHISSLDVFQMRYNIYQLLERIAAMQDSTFYHSYYYIKNSFDEFISGLQKKIIQYSDDFVNMDNIRPLTEILDVRFAFSMDRINIDGFDSIYLKMFDGVENRLQRIETSGTYVIVSNNEDIHTHLNESFTDEDANFYLNHAHKPNGYVDVVSSYLDVDKIGRLPARSLFLQSWYQNLHLNYPQQLITASLNRTRINNLHECINLKNLHSEGNIYTYNDISNLNLTRIYSKRDRYRGDSNECMFDVLIKKSNLEYIYIHNGDNIINSNSLQGNISCLRFFQHISYQKIQFKLNIDDLIKNNWIPYKLRFFNNCYYDKDHLEYCDLLTEDKNHDDMSEWIPSKILNDMQQQKRQIQRVGKE